jgi:NADH-quinone oxidoreductase subunit J
MNFTFPIYQVVFFVFAFVLIVAAFMVVVSRNPVKSILFLVLAFFASACLWMLMHAEFLSLLLIFVYVGAVMTLFLFVVMMLNIDLSVMRENFVNYLPFAVLVMLMVLGLFLYALSPGHFMEARVMPGDVAANYSNVRALGEQLFTVDLYPFEISGALLLVAIIAAIVLAFHGRKPHTKAQKIAEQHKVTKKDRLQIVNINPESKP